MAVQPQTPYIEHIANGTTTGFNLGFECDNQDHLIVLVDDIEPVVGAWSLTGGAVVFGAAPADGNKITIQRNTPFERKRDYQSYDNSFRPPVVNKDFDWIWLKLQELGVADWILGNRITALKSYVDEKDGQLQQNINNLKGYVDLKDDELRAYLMEEIRKQGVALDQLDDYYNYLMQRLAQIAVDRGWSADFVVTTDGSTQQQVNDRVGNTWYEKPLGYELNARVMLENGDVVKSTVANNIINPNADMAGWVKVGNLVFVNTVTEMISKKLKNGDVVKTLGYNNLFDNGGAFYVISSTATDYSIPLNNGSHAVFNDTFDIRKFGIVDDPSFTKVQDSNLTRMCRYADKYSYVVDFHNFSIKTPQTLFYPTGRGIQYRGLGFNKLHEIKNVNMAHNVGDTQQAEGLTHIMIKFLSYDDIKGELRFSNITLDGIIQNYITVVGESDAGFNGILIETHGLESTLWQQSNHRVFPLDIYYDNINFKTPCMSYAISASGFKSRKIVGRDIRGELVGLGAFVYAEHLDFYNIDMIYRNDLHTAGRELVRSVIHVEAEMGEGGVADIATIKLNNIKAVDSDGIPSLAFFTYSRGALNVGSVEFADIDGNIRFDHIGLNSGKVKKLAFTNVGFISLICDVVDINITNAKIKYWSMTNLSNNGQVEYFPFEACNFGSLTINSSNVEGVASPNELRFGGSKLVLNKCYLRGYGSGTIFTSANKVSIIEHNKCSYMLESMSIYTGKNDIITIASSKFLDASSNFTNITNASNHTNTLTLRDVTSDGVLTRLTSNANAAVVNLVAVSILNQIPKVFPNALCKISSVGLSSDGYDLIVPPSTTVPANGIVSWSIDLPNYIKSGDFTVVFSEQTGCIFTTQTTADLAALSVLKVYAQNTTGSPVSLGGKAFILNFTTSRL